MNKINIVLVNPEIPQNTGNISRTCAVTGAALHIVRPIGFEISDRTLKRAGLDYWDKLTVYYYDSFEELLSLAADAPFYYFSSHAERSYTEADYPEGVYLVFGRESAGLPDELHQKYPEQFCRIPMPGEFNRSLNLANAASIVLYEALRQNRTQWSDNKL